MEGRRGRRTRPSVAWRPGQASQFVFQIGDDAARLGEFLTDLVYRFLLECFNLPLQFFDLIEGVCFCCHRGATLVHYDYRVKPERLIKDKHHQGNRLIPLFPNCIWGTRE